MLRLHQASRTYPVGEEEIVALHAVDLEIRAGDVLVGNRTLTNIYEKEGRSGPLIFYEVVLEVTREDGSPVLTEKTTRLLR